ncbi:MAG: hypothetical protein ACK4R6_12820 [Spirosomataceae bacterium]
MPEKHFTKPSFVQTKAFQRVLIALATIALVGYAELVSNQGISRFIIYFYYFLWFVLQSYSNKRKNQMTEREKQIIFLLMCILFAFGYLLTASILFA